MISPAYTPEEDAVLLSYTADLDPQDYKTRTKDFTARFKQAALRLPGRAPAALRKRYLRLSRDARPDSHKVQTPSVASVSQAPERLIPQRVVAKPEAILWDDEPFIRPPSREQLMARR